MEWRYTQLPCKHADGNNNVVSGHLQHFGNDIETGSVSHLSKLIMCLDMTINRDIDIINVNWCTSAAVGFSRGCRFTINCSIGWRNTRIFIGFCRRSCYTISCCVGWCSIRALRGDVRLSNNVTSCGAGCWFLKQVTIIKWEYDAVLKPSLELSVMSLWFPVL